MSKFNSNQWLESRIRFGVKAGLDNITEALELLERPDQELQVILVAGTNGKGYTTSLLANLMTECGNKVGWFCSPHLVSVRERIRIANTPIPQLELDNICFEISQKCKSIELTYFEAITLIAILYFKQEGVDWCIFEVGLGGRLDSTNVLQPQISVITSIGLDHSEFLGHDLKSILFEKCGIMRPERPVFSQIIQNDLRDEIKKIATQKNADLRLLNFQKDLLQGHFKRNQDLAIAVIQTIYPQFHPLPPVLLDIIKSHEWAGRQQVIEDPVYMQKGATLMIDGAHNPESMRELKLYLETVPGKKAIVLGLMFDKELRLIFDEIVSMKVDVYFVRGDFPRFAEPEELVKKFNLYTGKDSTSISMKSLIDADFLKSKGYDQCTLSGSLYLIGEYISKTAHRSENLKWFRQFTPDLNEMSHSNST
tara:strand:- start:3238 stop:4506 length:1269 start_codon:yes stop_codon:yes gene_type:complete